MAKVTKRSRPLLRDLQARISTNVATGGQEVFDNFGLIERVTIVLETRDGRIPEVDSLLTRWLESRIKGVSETRCRKTFRTRLSKNNTERVSYHVSPSLST